MGVDVLIFTDHSMTIEEIKSIEEELNKLFPVGLPSQEKTYYQKLCESSGSNLWSWEIPPEEETLHDFIANIWGPNGVTISFSDNIACFHLPVRWRIYIDDNGAIEDYMSVVKKLFSSSKEYVIAPDYCLDVFPERGDNPNLDMLIGLFKENVIEFEKHKFL